jgi:hypothetical protein
VDWFHPALDMIRWRADETRNEILVYITGREFIDRLWTY